MNQNQPPFLENIIDESVEMQVLHPMVFDDFLAEGWRLLGHSIIRHNFAACRGFICRTIPLRIRLEGLAFSKSQRQILRRNADLSVYQGPIRLTPEKEALFFRHTERFRERRPHALASFLNHESANKPVKGLELSVWKGDRLLACSYVHLGSDSVSGTYCFFEPEETRRSLGTFTMLIELQWMREAGMQFYYHGYCYDVPSQFDYKLNFDNLEALDWATGQWNPHPRVPVRKWEELL